MEGKINILLINTQMFPAGAQKALLTLAANLDKSVFNVFVGTLYDKGNYIPQFEKEYELTINNFKLKDKKGLYRALAFINGLWNLYKFLKQNKIEIVQSYSHTANIILPIVSFFAGIKIRVTSQRMSLDRLPKKIQIADKLIQNSFFVKKIVSVSEGTRVSCIKFQKINPGKIVTIPNGIDIDELKNKVDHKKSNLLLKEFNIKNDNTIKIVVVARLYPQKGHKYLFEILPKIISHNKEVKFFLVGDGELRVEFEKYIRQSNLQDLVLLLGARNDVANILSISDIFILPSLWEGMPNSVMEAMALGVPVIATNVDGTPELINSNEVGRLVPAANSQALLKSLVELIDDEQLRKRISSEAMKHLNKHFSLNQTIKLYTQLYLELYNQYYQ